MPDLLLLYRCAVKMDSPAEMALQLMEKIMNGDEVSGQEAFTVRMAILQVCDLGKLQAQAKD